jgi:predicted small metal-binding protein
MYGKTEEELLKNAKEHSFKEHGHMKKLGTMNYLTTWNILEA